MIPLVPCRPRRKPRSSAPRGPSRPTAIVPCLTDDEYAYYLSLEGAANLLPLASEAVGAFVQRHRTWLASDRERARIRAAWAEFFTRVDVLVCPVIASPAFAHLQEGTYESRVMEIDGVTRPYADLGWWPMLIGMAYLPSTVVPVGQTSDGLPIGVQVVGPYLEDRTTLAVAKALTNRLGDPVPPPIAR